MPPTHFGQLALCNFSAGSHSFLCVTYTTNTVAHNAFDTPTTESVVGITDGNKLYEAKNLLINDSILIVSHGHPLASGIECGGVFYPASQVIINGNDTIVNNHNIAFNENGMEKVAFNKVIPSVSSITIDGTNLQDCSDVKVKDYLSRLQEPFKLTEAAIVATGADGKLSVEDASSHYIENAANCSYETKTVLNSATPQYNDAGNWVGLLYAIRALGSVVWAVLLPKFKSRKFSYSLSLLLAGVGFIMMSFITNQYLLFVAFILIGCGWAAMLARPSQFSQTRLKAEIFPCLPWPLQLHHMPSADCCGTRWRLDSVSSQQSGRTCTRISHDDGSRHINNYWRSMRVLN